MNWEMDGGTLAHATGDIHSIHCAICIHTTIACRTTRIAKCRFPRIHWACYFQHTYIYIHIRIHIQYCGRKERQEEIHRHVKPLGYCPGKQSEKSITQ